MKKVSILSLHLGYGGIEKSICALANMLVNNYDVELAITYKLYDNPSFELDPKVKLKYLTTDRTPNAEKWKESIKRVKPVTFVKESIYSFSTLTLRKKTMIDYIKKCNSDIIISTRDIFNTWLGKYGKKNTYKIGWEHNHHHGNKKYINKIVKSVSNLDSFVLVSSSLREFYQKKLKNIACYYIPNVIDEIPSSLSNLKEKRLIAVGRLCKEKGYRDLIEMFKQVHKDYPDWHLDIIGDGKEKLSLQKLIDNYKLNEYIRLHGFQGKEYINNLLMNSSIYCMTSYTESFGIVLIEAMSHGIPCVAFSSAEGATELINNNINGYLIDNRNKKEYINKLKELMNNTNLRRVIGKKGYKTSLDYTSQRVSKIWLDLLEKR